MQSSSVAVEGKFDRAGRCGRRRRTGRRPARSRRTAARRPGLSLTGRARSRGGRRGGDAAARSAACRRSSLRKARRTSTACRSTARRLQAYRTSVVDARALARGGSARSNTAACAADGPSAPGRSQRLEALARRRAHPAVVGDRRLEHDHAPQAPHARQARPRRVLAFRGARERLEVPRELLERPAPRRAVDLRRRRWLGIGAFFLAAVRVVLVEQAVELGDVEGLLRDGAERRGRGRASAPGASL